MLLSWNSLYHKKLKHTGIVNPDTYILKITNYQKFCSKTGKINYHQAYS